MISDLSKKVQVHSGYTDDDVFRAAEMIYTLGNPAALPAARQAAREWERRVFWGMGRDFRRKVMRRVRAMRMMRAV